MIHIGENVDTRPILPILELNPLSRLVSTPTSLSLVTPNLLPNLLALLNLVVTAGPRWGYYPLIRLPHSIGTDAAGPAQAQLSC